MKTVMLLRHGKSNLNSGGDDHARTLTERGIDAAQRVGRYLTKIDQIPERVVSSSATRAQETLRQAAAAGEWQREIEVDPQLYDTSAGRMLEWLQQLDDAAQSVLLAGHQPTWSMLTSALIGGGQLRFPSAGLVRIDLEIGRWREVQLGCGELVWFQPPRILQSID